MTKGQYTIDMPKGSGHADTSFRACIIGLLIFFLFCVTIIIILLVAKGTKKSPDSDSPHHDHLSDSERHTTSEPSVPSEESKRGSEGREDTSSETPLTTNPHAPVNTYTMEPTTAKDSTAHAVTTEPTISRDNSTEDSNSSISVTLSSSTVLSSTPRPAPKPVPCETVECKKLAANIVITMGKKAKPCQHFYEYACGGLRQNKYLLEPNYAYEAFQQMNDEVNKISNLSPESYQKFKALEHSCNTYDPSNDLELWKSAVLDEMKELGSIHLSEESSTFAANFTHLFLRLLQHDRPFIFDVSLDVNDRDKDKFAVKIFPAEMTKDQMYPDEITQECQFEAAKIHRHLNNIYDETMKCMNQGKGRRKVMNNAKIALDALGIPEAKSSELLQDYETYLDSIKQNLNDRVSQRLELQDRDPEWKTIADLNKIFENLQVNWTAVLHSLIDSSLKESDEMQLYSFRYFTHINDYFKNRQRQLQNALLVALASARHRDLVEAQRRWRRELQPLLCTRAAALLLPDAAAALYLHSFDKGLLQQLQHNASHMHFTLAGLFQDELDAALWLNDGLKEDLKRKMAGELRNFTDTPAVMSVADINENLKDYTIDETNFITNALMLMERNRRRLYKRFDEKPADHIWTHFVQPYDTEAISIYSLNIIAIPLGAMQRPYFHPTYPEYIQIAGLGFSVAHELAHLIDRIGVKFHVNDTGLAKYKNKLPSLLFYGTDEEIEYLNETGSNQHQKLGFTFSDDQRSLKNNEISSDKMGIRVAYKYFSKINKKQPVVLPYISLTNDQTFFVYLAQKFCTKMDFISMITEYFETSEYPPETRVLKMTQNNADFAKAFNCAPVTDLPFPYCDSCYEPDDDSASK